MAKAKKAKRDDVVMVRAASSFTHDGVLIRTGQHVEMSLADARDLVALCMARIVEQEPAR